MKFEHLTIIFAIIIIPITIVLSIYINNKIKTQKLELTYNKRLFSATQDAVDAYQSNTLDNAFADVTNAKITDIESSINIFMTSLASNFNYIGYKADALKQYIPAVVFTLYDGYYIYSPFSNTMTEVRDDDYDPKFSEPNVTIKGLKPYVYYTCRYTPKKDTDFFITYTLDNYITIQGKINNKYVYDYGYLYDIASLPSEKGIYYEESENSYYYMGIEFKNTDTEELKEYVGGTEYSYVKINGKKYYLDENYYSDEDYEKYKHILDDKSNIFFINTDGSKSYTQVNPINEHDQYVLYVKAIKNNKSAFEYFKHAYEFSKAVLGKPVEHYEDKSGEEVSPSGYGLKNLKVGDSVYYKDASDDKLDSFKTFMDGETKIFDSGTTLGIESEASNFNAHRKSVIRQVVQTNLTAAIVGYKDSTKSDIDYIMPKISETDWENIENEICVISFLQGMSIGSKIFNSYKVVPNAYTTDYIGAEDIYLLKDDNTYCKINDKSLKNNTLKQGLGYKSGVWNLNCRLKKILEPVNQSQPELGNQEVWYFPVRDGSDDSQAYTGSYTSIITNYDIDPMENNDIYQYLKNMESDDERNALIGVYLKALARERWGGFNINNINYEIYGNNGNKYFLNDYKINRP